MEPIHKFNSGMGGMICNTCRTIISTGPATKELYCEKCKPKQEIIMKNIHVISTDKPSKLSDCHNNNLHLDDVRYLRNYQNIYITSDEIVTEYSKGLYFIDIYTNTRHIFSPIYINKDTIAAGKFHTYMNNGDMCKKVIMTTDPILILNGVQAIDDEFLEWICKNPSCEEVEVVEVVRDSKQSTNSNGFLYIEWLEYKIIIPKEEQKQHLINMMKTDEELGLYEEPKQETIKIACVQCCGTGEIQKSTNRKQSNFECDLCNGRGHWNKVIEPKQENALEEKEWLIIFKEYVKDNECNLYTFFNWLETNYNSPTKK